MTEAQLAYQAYTANLITLNTVLANRYEPGEITIPDWPTLPPGASDTCILSSILALSAFITLATACLIEHPDDAEAAQDCIDAKHALCVAAISGCVSQS